MLSQRVSILASGFMMLAVVMTGGCASDQQGVTTSALAPPDSAHLSPTERELRAQVRQQRQLEGAGIGCVAGAGFGVATALLTGNKQHAVRNAAVGCVAGGAIGLAWGSYVDARAQGHANDQERVQKLTLAAQQDVERYKRVNALTQKLIDEEKSRLAQAKSKKGRLTQAVAAQETSAQDRARTISDLEAQVKEIEDNVRTIDIDRNEFASRGTDASQLTVQRQALVAQQNQLMSNVQVLRSLSSASS